MSPTDDAVPWEPAIARYLDAGGELAGDAFERWLQEQPEFDLSDEEVERAAAIVEMCAELDALGGLDSVRTRSASGAREFGNEPKVRAASRGASIGPYVLKRFIARGGMGEVWEAEEVELGRRVALKLVLPERIDARALDMFAREAKAGSRVQHPGIVTTLAYGRGDELSWIAQELVPGSSTLKGVIDELRSEEIVPRDHYRRVAEIVAEIASALQAAHDVGVVHRDVKPSNVLMTPDGRPKVVDFGLARVVDDSFLSLTGEIAGTWAYMSPEQVKAKRIGLDHRTDIFSLGVVLYELLTLRRPFEGDTTHQIAERIVAYDPVDATKVRSQCPRDLAVIAGKCLEKDRERRYTTMSDVAADLRRHLGQEPIVARPPGRIRKLELWARRNPAKSLAGAIAAAAFIAISLLLAENVRARRDLASEVESVKRLSALQDYDDLVALADTLWPPHPANVDAYETWIDEAARLVAELPVHRAKREELGRIAGAGGAFPQTPAGGDARWWSANLDKLIASLESLTDETTGLLSSSPSAVSIEHGWSVPRRLAFATSIRDGLARGASFSDRWSEAIASIAADPTYGGLELAAQPGLVPIGRDPASGLWEFWHVATGDEPRRNESGALEPTAASGIVLVLIPSGTFWMGSTRDVDAPRNIDDHAEGDESPVHEVMLSAYFLSKYEMTQGQWLRFTGENPSRWTPDFPLGGIDQDLSHPVEQLSWDDCRRVLPRMGLALPTEAQWENGCRAGTSTPWWTGDEKESLRGATNLADKDAKALGAPPNWLYEPWLEDGARGHAPVGSYTANPFGLHDTCGNLWEWCLDGYDRGFYAASPRVDPVAPWDDAEAVVYRGGSFGNFCWSARSADRSAPTVGYADPQTGVRAARAIEE